ncbi:hypothetical protein [Flavobacterium sp.]
MKNIKKTICILILPLVVVIGLLFVNCETKKETKSSPKTLSVANKKDNLDKRKKWEASPDGIKYKEWEASPEGKKVHTSYDKIKENIKALSDMEAVVSSLTFQRKNAKSGPKWMIVRIKDDEYMMQFIPKDFEKLNSLKVNDTIVLKSSSVGFSPNHPFLILSVDYIAHNNKVLFKRDLSKNKRC